MNFGKAIEELKNGKKVCRNGWNGKGMWLELQTPTELSKMTLPPFQGPFSGAPPPNLSSVDKKR